MSAHPLTGAPAGAAKAPDATWLRRLTPPGPTAPEVRLICFPHAGGAAGAFTPLARALAPRVDALGVQYPGRQDRRREPALDIPGLADRLAEVLAPLTDLPYALFGHSMGALVAFETADRLRRLTGPGPVHLFLSGRSAPVVGPVQSDRLDSDADLLARIRELGGTSGLVLDDPELTELVLGPLRADYRALRGYTWPGGPPLDRPCTVLTGDADPLVRVTDAAAWARHTTAPTEVRVFPGGHFYLADRAADVARAVTAGLTGTSPSNPADPTRPRT